MRGGAGGLAGRTSMTIAGRAMAALLSLLVFSGYLAFPPPGGAESPISAPGMTLVFKDSQARSIGDTTVALPVRCLGDGRAFCSGVVTLSRNGHRHTVPFSVRGGCQEALFVPLRHGIWKGHPRKVRALASTSQPLGAPTLTRELFFAR